MKNQAKVRPDEGAAEGSTDWSIGRGCDDEKDPSKVLAVADSARQRIE